MCDYSLCGLPTRLAADGEVLAVHRFRTGSMGLASPVELKMAERAAAPARRRGFWSHLKSMFEENTVAPPVTAVCVPPGTQMVLKNIPDDQRRRWKIGETEPVTFVQLSANAYSYRDAVRFRNGIEVLLQNLREGTAVQIVCVGDPAPTFNESAVPVL